MPMFYTPKPRQFHYNPRFYDPEKEKWEAIHKKYRQKENDAVMDNSNEGELSNTDSELAYFQNRVHQIERNERKQSSQFGIMDLFRKRKMPEFHYTPRFSNNDSQQQSDIELKHKPRTKIKIARRFDFEDEQYFKPMPAGRIMLYGLAAFIILCWIIL